MANIQLWTII